MNYTFFRAKILISIAWGLEKKLLREEIIMISGIIIEFGALEDKIKGKIKLGNSWKGSTR